MVIKIKNLNNGQVFEHQTDYVFIGAGAIPLLQKLAFQKVNI